MSDVPAGPPPASFHRHDALRDLAAERFDVLVIGGGVTGAGVALDAASRGLRTALVEKDDFASGTSSKSSKMVHGGIRYLQQREFRLVYENLAERQRLLENAPHLVSPLPFLIPLFGRDGVVSRAVARSYATALWLYDLTGGVRIGSRHRRVSRQEALAHLPTLDTDRLVAGFLYFDARADDARLTLDLVRTAVLDFGAVAANYTPVVELLEDRGRVCGARVRPRVRPGGAGQFGEVAEGPEFEISASVVVNATGVWADEVRVLDTGPGRHSLRPAKGVHLTVPSSRLPADIASVIPVHRDRRSIFVVPWPEVGMVYVGTTDTDYRGSLDQPHCEPPDVDYLLQAVNAVTTSRLTREDVTGVWAGLRPLLAPTSGHQVSDRTSDLSRRHQVFTEANGLITVTGGKLTTYRRMAQDTLDQVVAQLPRSSGGYARCRTKHLALRGAPRPGGGQAELPGVEPAVAAHLFGRYGTEAPDVLAVAAGRPELLAPAVEGLPYLRAELLYAVRSEMAQTLDDLLARRTRASIQDARRTAGAAPALAALVAPEIGWSEEQAAAQAARFSAAVLGELAAAGLPGADRADLGSRP